MLVSAVLVVASAVASTAHGTLQDRHEFLNVTVPLHRDPAVAADLSGQVAAQLEDDGGVSADGSTEVAPLIEQMIRSEEFGPVWRSALLRAHDHAVNGGSATGDVVGEALPGLGARLAQEGAPASPDFEERPVQLVPAAYVAELRSVIGLASRAAKVLPLAAVALAGFALYRSRNRMRAGALLGVATAVVAFVTVVAIAPLSDLVVSRAVAEPVQPFAMAAAGGLGSTVRTIVVFVAMMAVLLAVAGRLEEVRSAPPFPVADDRHGSRRGRSWSWNPRRSYRAHRASRSYRSYRGSRFSRSYRHDVTRRWSDRGV